MIVCFIAHVNWSLEVILKSRLYEWKNIIEQSADTTLEIFYLCNIDNDMFNAFPSPVHRLQFDFEFIWNCVLYYSMNTASIVVAFFTFCACSSNTIHMCTYPYFNIHGFDARHNNINTRWFTFFTSLRVWPWRSVNNICLAIWNSMAWYDMYLCTHVNVKYIRICVLSSHQVCFEVRFRINYYVFIHLISDTCG